MIGVAASKEAPLVRRVDSSFGPFARNPKARRAKQIQGFNVVIGIVLQCKQESSYRRITVCPIAIPAEQQRMPDVIGKIDEAGNLCLVTRDVKPRGGISVRDAKPEDWVPLNSAEWYYTKVEPFTRFNINDFDTPIGLIPPMTLVKIYDMTTSAYHPKRDGAELADEVAHSLNGLIRVSTMLPDDVCAFDVVPHLPTRMQEIPNILAMLAKRAMAHKQGLEITIRNQAFITQLTTNEQILMSSFSPDCEQDFAVTFVKRPTTNLSAKISGISITQEVMVPFLPLTGIAINHVAGRAFCADLNLQVRREVIRDMFGVQTGKVWEVVYNNVDFDGWYIDASIKASDVEYPENTASVNRILDAYKDKDGNLVSFDVERDEVDISAAIVDAEFDEERLEDPDECEKMLKRTCAFKSEGYVNQLFVPRSQTWLWDHSIPVTADFLKKKSTKWVQSAGELEKFGDKITVLRHIVCLSESTKPMDSINSDLAAKSRLRVMLPIYMGKELDVLSKLTPSEGDAFVNAVIGERGTSKMPAELLAKGIDASLAGQNVLFFAAFIAQIAPSAPKREYDFSRFLETGAIVPIERVTKRQIEYTQSDVEKKSRTDDGDNDWVDEVDN